MIEIVSAYDRMEDMLELVKEYTDDIMQHGEDVKECLSSQHLSSELADMNRKYGSPYGRMYLALADGKTAGCVALARNDDMFCEIKRLYVRPQFRGKHISRELVDKVITDARNIGYRYMRLDTFPFMESAIKLYEKYGFYHINRYNDNPAESAVFMQLNL